MKEAINNFDTYSSNRLNENIKRIGELFPTCLTERMNGNGEVEQAIDFDILKQELSPILVEGNDERYQFTWAGKRNAILLANTPTTKRFQCCREESVDFDSTKNLYIEGDNLDALKLLQKDYSGKVKMIYIDPPYNTGKKYLYNDKYAQSIKEYKARFKYGEIDELDLNGRFHTNWLNMMYPRLKLARDLLRDDGVIFISIDDNEQENLKKICNEIFGESNFIQGLIWQRTYAPKNDSRYASKDHDFVLCYAKNIKRFSMGRLTRTETANSRYKNPDNDPRGAWLPDNLSAKTYSARDDYPITTPSGRIVNPPHGTCWRVSKDRYQKLVDDNRIWFGKDGNCKPRLKRFLHELKFEGLTASSLMLYQDVGGSNEGRLELKKIFDDKGYFDNPKPIRLLNRLLTLANTSNDDTILDFFSGSATAAHAVIQLNAEDGGNRRYIMVQLPEVCAEGTEAAKAGHKNICEIGKERIRRAGRKIKEENKNKDGIEDLDVGFKVIKLVDTNLRNIR